MERADDRSVRAIPTGMCWCGCGQQLPVGSFFAAGHDKKAEARVIREVYGGVAEFILYHGYDPISKSNGTPNPPLPDLDPRNEDRMTAWRNAMIERARARIAEDVRRFRSLGIVDPDGKILKAIPPADMQPDSKTGI